jgi:hypothetical protein
LILTGLTCSSNTGQLIHLPHAVYHYLNSKHEILNKFKLHTDILQMCPPMIELSQKAINAFLDLFQMQICKAGQVIMTESASTRAVILIDGDVMSFKRMIEMQSSTYEHKEQQRGQLLQNQSLRHMRQGAHYSR